MTRCFLTRCYGFLLLLLAATASFAADHAQVYKTVEGRDLKLYVTRPSDWQAQDRRPAVVFYHGGGFVGGNPRQFENQAAHLARRGAVTFEVEYRLLQPGSRELPTRCIQDAESAMRWVRSHAAEWGVDPQRIAAAGGSAGGHLAAFLGLVEGMDDPADDRSVSAKPNAMLLFNPVLDNGPGGWGYDRLGERYREFSPFHNVTSNAPPAIVMAGSADKLIPVKTIHAFQDAMRRAGVRCEVRIYDGQPHGFFNFGRGDSRYYRETLQAVDDFLVSLGWLSPGPAGQSQTPPQRTSRPLTSSPP
jgi:acetyl esterase/lipase